MALHLSEEEQLEALKNWWKAHGTKTVAVIAILGASYFGWTQYQSHIEHKAQAGSKVYDEFVATTSELQSKAGEGKALSADAKAEVEDLAKELDGEYGDSLYADFAQFYVAKVAVEAGDYDTARAELNKVLDSSVNAGVQHLAKLRLARVEMAAGEYQTALDLLQGDVDPAFADAVAELRGDVYLMQKQYDEARTAYQTALNAITDPRSMRRSLVQLKLDNATVASPEAQAAPAATADEAEGV